MDNLSALTLVFALVVVVLCAWHFLLGRHQRGAARLPPSVGLLSLLVANWRIVRGAPVYNVLWDMSRQLGDPPLMSFRRGWRRVIVLNSAEAVADAYVRGGAYFSDRLCFVGLKLSAQIYCMSVIRLGIAGT